MITTVIMQHGAEIAVDEHGTRPVATHFGKSSDVKPVDGVNNADRFLEMDTNNLYLFDYDAKEWLPV